MNWEEIKSDKNIKEYINFLKNNQKLYFINDFPFSEYRRTLIPALSLPIEPPQFSKKQLKDLLKKSNLLLIRWSSNFTEKETEWWWVNCYKPFELDKLSRKARNQIKRGLKNCQVKKIEVEWLAQNGYQCYEAAFQRYENAKPVSKNIWQKNFMQKKSYNCFDFWGVFINTKLVGYCGCIKIFNTVSTSVIKYDPDYLKFYPAYALTYTILNYYLNKENYKLITNGTRSIAHDTNIQTFLEKFGFKKQYCQLNVVYSPLLKNLIGISYPLKKIFKIFYNIIPINFLYEIDVILTQEKIRRSFKK